MPSIAKKQYEFNSKLAKDLEQHIIDCIQVAQKRAKMQSDLKAVEEEFAR